MNNYLKNKVIVNSFFGIVVAAQSLILYYLLINVPFLSGMGRFWPYNLMFTALLSVFISYLTITLVRGWKASYKQKIFVIFGILITTALIMNLVSTAVWGYRRAEAERILNERH